MKRRIIACAALVTMFALLCGCTLPWQSSGRDVVMTVSGAQIEEDLYAYYLAQILHEPEKYGLTDPDRKAAEDKTVQLCTEYVAVNSMFADEGLTLTPEYKNRIAENVSTKWGFYKNFYEKVGIRKQTVTKYETNTAKREMLIAHKYGEGGSAAVPKIELDAFYAVNYVTFQSINGYLTRTGSNGKSERLPPQEIAAVEDRFKQMCELVRTGSSLEEVAKANASSAYILSAEAETLTINRTTNNYPPEFFSKVQQMDVGSPCVIEAKDYIFLVVKLADKNDENLQAHRMACLLEKCAEPFQGDLTAVISGYKVQKDSSALGKIFGTVSKRF